MTNVPFLNSVTNVLSKNDVKGLELADALMDITEGNEKLDDLLTLKSSASEIDGNINRSKLTLIALGDSITNGGGGAGDSFGMLSPWHGHIAYGNAMAGSPFNLLYNAGIGGQTSSQIEARVESDVILRNPTHCIFMMGANDGVVDSAKHLLKANILSTYNKLNNAGIYSFICTLTGVNGNSGKNQLALEINEWIYNTFKDKPNCEIIDIFSVWIDPLSITGNPNMINMRDEIHPNNVGGWYAGKKVSEHFKKFKRSDSSLPVSVYDNNTTNITSKQYVKNPLQTGNTGNTGVNATGQTSTSNYTYCVSGATMVCSKEARVDGYGDWQVLEITGGTNSYSFARFQASTSAITAGSEVVVEIELFIEELIDVRNIRLTFGGSTRVDFFGTSSGASTAGITDTNIPFVIKSSPYIVLTDIVAGYNMNVDVYFDRFGTAKIKVGRMTVRKIN